ncbi:uncharacterized protein PAC_16785 [Phialocephala subalpina]|uniref:Phytocyanin domain-containing protein n=1 Tax=Phialocephala subalpina TaxID=576137 RepID=A0A1L7XPD3_9HELO|nr:uncharacterized protein PAC_16785 [Phialocephala subalpina]
MRLSSASLIAAAASASAETIQVAVGQSGLTFSPNDITAAVGDSVEFSFFPKNHSVTQSSFAKPCQPLANGFFSTFQPTTSESANTFTILVNDTKPIWLYCGQTTGNHCQSGMVAAINAPTTGNTLTAFTALAKNATTPSTSPPGGQAFGGVLKVGSASSNSSSSSSGASSSSVAEKTVTASVTTTVTALVTSGGSSYTTTYGTTYGTTYTTPVAAGATGSGSSTTSAAQSTGTNGANGLMVNGGIAGAALVFALGML